MKTLKKLLAAAVMLVMIFSLAACGSSNDSAEEPAEATEGETQIIDLAITEDIVPLTDRVAEPLKEAGYELNTTVYEDYVMPNQALMEGKYLYNFMQHEPYMNDFNASNDADLVMITPKIVYTPFLIMSESIDSLENIPDGATMALPDSPSIREHALSAIQESGLIKLADEPKDGQYFAPVDIVENSKNLQFVETDHWTTATMMQETDLVCLATDQAEMNELDITKALYRETPASGEKYAWGLASRPDNKDDEAVQALNAAFHTDAFRDALEKDYPGIYGFIED